MPTTNTHSPKWPPFVASLMLAGFCAACQDKTTVEEQALGPEVSIDQIINLAAAAKDEIVKRSPIPEDWGDLRLTEYDPDFRMSGLPAFTYVDRSTVRIKEPGKIAYTDLEFMIKDGEVAHIQSRLRIMLTSRAEGAEFMKTVADFAVFPHPISFYIDKAKEEILKSEGEKIPKGAYDLQLAGIRFQYFDRPQTVEISFQQISTIERTESSQSSTSFDRSLDPTGAVISENDEAEQGGGGRPATRSESE